MISLIEMVFPATVLRFAQISLKGFQDKTVRKTNNNRIQNRKSLTQFLAMVLLEYFKETFYQNHRQCQN